MKVSNCCEKQGFIKKFDGRLSGTNYYDSELMGICPKCGEPCEYVEEENSITGHILDPNDLGGTGHGDISYSDADSGL